MKKVRSAEEKFGIVLEVLTTSTPVSEICRQHNVNNTQIYEWKKQFLDGARQALAGKRASAAGQLEAENEQLKGLVADLTLANAIFKKIQAGRR